MIYVYVGAAVIAGLLIGFLVLSITWVSFKTSDSVNAHAISLLSEYDGMIQKKSQRLSELEKELLNKKAELDSIEHPESFLKDAGQAGTGSSEGVDAVKVAEMTAAAKYRERNIKDIYEKINTGFCKDPIEELKLLIANRTVSGGPDAAESILGKVSADDFYRLSVLPSSDQISLLETVLNSAEEAFLKEYTKAHNEFSSLEFFEELKKRSREKTAEIKVYVKPGYLPAEDIGESCRIIHDEDIIEGFYIYIDGNVYDYSLRRKEIS